MSGRQRVGQGIAVHRLNIGKPHGRVHLLVGLQPLQQCLFTVIVPLGNQQSHHILGAKGLVNPLLGDLSLVLTGRFNLAVAVDVRTPVGEQKAAHQTQCENRHPDEAQLHSPGPPAVDAGNKIFVPGPLHRLAKNHQKARHQSKYRQHAQADGLDQHHTHIKANAKLHKHHGSQTGNGRQAASGDRGNRGAQSGNACLSISGVLPFLQKAVQ